MLIATFLTTIFYSATYPYIHKEIMAVASNNLLAISQIINCLSIVVFGSVWNRYSNRLFWAYPVICVGETVLGVGSTIYAALSHNIAAYYILDTLIFAIVTRNILCGGVKLKAMRYKTEKAREEFDNNNNSASAIATILGSCIAMVLKLDLIAILWIATVGNAIDNGFYIFIFYRTNAE